MLYNNGFPANYQMTPQEFAAYQQQQQMRAMQQQTWMQPQAGTRLWVKGRAEADAYPVAPNRAVDLWDSTAPRVFHKQADASGRVTLSAQRLVDEPDDSEPPRESAGQEYALKSELAAVSEAVESLRAELIGAAKRKPVKKDEADE